ncbi:hypothetical protein ACKKBG_A38255 [Auxenochlorella protothecoides x Auxenochlorella symbiontica]
MASRSRTFMSNVALLVLSLGVLSEGACTSKIFSLPAATYGPHVYMLELNSADNLCKSQGYSKAGSVRTTTLNSLGLSVSAIRMSPFEVIKARSTKILVAVECLKTGQKACAADKKGNIGTGNTGKNNFGDYNDGDNNIGVSLSPSKEHVSSSTISEITSSTFPPPSFPLSSSALSSPHSASALSSPHSASALSSPLSASPLSSPLSASPLSFSPLPSAVSSSSFPSVVSSSPLPSPLAPPPPSPPSPPPPPPTPTLAMEVTVSSTFKFTITSTDRFQMVLVYEDGSLAYTWAVDHVTKYEITPPEIHTSVDYHAWYVKVTYPGLINSPVSNTVTISG